MKTTIHYDGSESDKILNALYDIERYLGKEKYQNLFDAIKKLPHTKSTAEGLRLQMGLILGIEGFPILAIIAAAWEKSIDEIIDMDK